MQLIRELFQLWIISLLFCAPSLSLTGQTVVVAWYFPDNPDDAIADSGSPVNAGTTLSLHGGAGPAVFVQEGYTTNCAAAQNWAGGALTKYWQIDFSTEGYGDLTFESKQKSFSPQDFGPKDFLIQYRIGTSPVWTTFATFEIPPGNHWFQIAPTALPKACDNKPLVRIRWLMLTNEPTQGSGEVNDTAYNRLDDIYIRSYCPVPLALASPVSQTICPGTAITPIILTDTNEVPGTSFSWVRDNTTILTGIPSSGIDNPITGTLYSTQPQQSETTTFTITAEAAGCSSETTATVTVVDSDPPVFSVMPDTIYWCVQDIIEAWWDGMGDITPDRPDYHTFIAGSTILDLDPSTFSDNCTAPEDLILHWQITLAGGTIITGTGQISLYPQDIQFPLGDNLLTYWLEDSSGNLTPEALRPEIIVTVLPRPDIVQNF